LQAEVMAELFRSKLEADRLYLFEYKRETTEREFQPKLLWAARLSTLQEKYS